MSMEEKKVIKKKKKKKGARTAVILALVLASGVGGAFLWKQKKAAGAAKTNDQVHAAAGRRIPAGSTCQSWPFWSATAAGFCCSTLAAGLTR